MTGYERRNLIMKELEIKSSVTVNEMIKVLKTSESTVRRDFDTLVNDGLAINIYGGIAGAFSTSEPISIRSSAVLGIDTKDALSKATAEKIEDGMFVFIDGGTTFLTLMKYLKSKKITIVTNNSLLLADTKGSVADINMLGGSYDSRYYITTGRMTLDELSIFKFDVALITCDAMEKDGSMAYCADYNIASIKELAMSRTDKSYLVTESTKFNKKGLYGFAKTKEFDLLITDPCEYLSKIPIDIFTV